VATTILLKMHGPKFMWITCGPLVWLVAACFTAGWQKIFAPEPSLGFLAHANQLEQAMRAHPSPTTATLIFNDRLDAVVTGIFLILVATILVDSLRTWTGILRGTRDSRVCEAPFVPSALQPEEV
jgi:carbon starvation protein